jgi:hypothetical protein
MTHITEARVIGNHADMGGSTTVATRTSLTLTDILRAGRQRRIGRREMIAARSMWDSEGGAIGNESGQGPLVPRFTRGVATTSAR